MYKTCKDIEGSLYVAPNEIRACCQRFFYKGEIRGDAQLITIKDGQTPTNSDLLKARKKIFEQIQKNEKNNLYSEVLPSTDCYHILRMLEFDYF